ncbi:putative membrane protein YGL010W [Pseudomonas hunanensis]|uniref:Membrane protein YGL010W n=1 Tax=Pseudomonas hunanensis TaxID=1247546 RepID=A0ACC6K303_9PSED|nr:Mpo1-like protein [Pseudomonas hunanensis]MDR6712834.1 putative membrane protein YGL010W [Pseudomonas hunanensis]
MKSLVEHLSQYAGYHRDPRNIATHFVGIPLIVLAVTILLSRPGWDVAGIWLSPALLAAAAAVWFYLRLDLRFGLVMGLLLGLCLWLGQVLAVQATGLWLSAGLAAFVLGWIIQFVGHYYEGRKPAFVDDLSGLIIGPLFVVAEAAFMLGLCPALKKAVEANAGPVALRQKKAAV